MKTSPKTAVRRLLKEMMLGANRKDIADQVAEIVYHHFHCSEDGASEWATVWDDEEEKVDHIFDSIYTKYTEELGWMTEEEWQFVSEPLYNMVFEGVF